MKRINESMANTHEAIEAVGRRFDSASEGDVASWQIDELQSRNSYYKGKLMSMNEERMRLIKRFERLKEATPELERANAAGDWEVE